MVSGPPTGRQQVLRIAVQIMDCPPLRVHQQRHLIGLQVERLRRRVLLRRSLIVLQVDSILLHRRVHLPQIILTGHPVVAGAA